MRLNKEKIKNENIEKNKMKIVWYEDDGTSISVSCGYESWTFRFWGREMGLFKKGKKFRKNHKPSYSTAKDLRKRKK